MWFPLVILNALSASALISHDYCNKELCTRDEKVLPHIACHNNGDWSKNCKDPKLIPVEGTELETLILEIHNEYRNRIANGSVSTFPQAAKMTTQRWNSELAYLAELNARRCLFEHDECHSTFDFPFAGQNLAYFDSFGGKYDNEHAIRVMLATFFDEYVDVGIKDLRSVGRLYNNGKPIGHFTQVAQDRANQLGCALSQYLVGQWLRTNLVCNYSYGNIFTTKVYEEGESCSLCVTGCSEDYPALCNATEVVPNKCDGCA